MTVPGTKRTYLRFSWLTLVLSAALGLLFAIFLAVAPNFLLSDPGFRVGSAPLAIRAWGITWLGFSILALAVVLLPYRRRERWAWYAAWLLPLLWLSHFILAPDTPHNLVLAVVTALGLILPYRLFFSASAARPSRRVG